MIAPLLSSMFTKGSSVAKQHVYNDSSIAKQHAYNDSSMFTIIVLLLSTMSDCRSIGTWRRG